MCNVKVLPTSKEDKLERKLDIEVVLPLSHYQVELLAVGKG